MNHGHPVPLLELRHVSVTEGLSGRPLVRDVSFSLQRGHCLGIVGESGSGKSLLCRALLGLLPSGMVRSGQLHFDGRDLGRLDPAGWRELRGTGMAVILQQAMTAFDPLRPLGKQLAGTLRARRGCPRPGPVRPSVRPCNGWGCRRPSCTAIRISCPAACCNAA